MVILETNINFAEVDGVKLYLDIVYPQEKTAVLRPALLIACCSGWSRKTQGDGMMSQCCPYMAEAGFVAASFQIRTVDEAPFPAQIYPAKAAVRWLRANAEQYQIDPDKIGIFGHSAGGHIAALIAVTGDMPELEGDGGSLGYSSKVQAFAAASAPYDFLTFGGAIDDDAELFQRMFGGKISERESLARLASPLTHVSPSTPPGLVAHGTLDETAPFRHAELFSNKLRAHNVEHEFHALEGCYHNWSTSLDSWSGFGNEDNFYVMARSFFEKQFL